MSNDPVVAIVGVTGAVGRIHRHRTDAISVSASSRRWRARSAGKTVAFRGKPVVIEGSPSVRLTASTSRCSRPAAAFPEVRAIGGQGRRRRDRQFLPSHGPDRAAGDPEIARAHPRSQGHHRQPELRRDRRAVAAADHRANRIKRLIIATYQAASGAARPRWTSSWDHPRQSRGRLYQQRCCRTYAFNLFNHNTTIDPRPATTTRRPRSSRRPQDLRGREDRGRRHLRARAGAARALRVARMRTAGRRGRCPRCWPPG